MTDSDMTPVNAERNPVVFEKEGEVFTNSRDVAAYFGKNHRDVMRAVDNLIQQEQELGLRNFAQGVYTLPETHDQQHRCYDMDRDGFTLLAMGFTGAKALKWKLCYIEAFNAMEAELARQTAMAGFNIPSTLSDALRLAADQAETIEKQTALIADMTPKAEFHDDVASAINAQTFLHVAKALKTGRTRFTRWLRESIYLMADNSPYQQFIDRGYFRVVEKKRKDPSTGEFLTYTQTLVTGKGFTYLQKRWVEHQEQQKAA